MSDSFVGLSGVTSSATAAAPVPVKDIIVVSAAAGALVGAAAALYLHGPQRQRDRATSLQRYDKSRKQNGQSQRRKMMQGGSTSAGVDAPPLKYGKFQLHGGSSPHWQDGGCQVLDSTDLSCISDRPPTVLAGWRDAVGRVPREGGAKAEDPRKDPQQRQQEQPSPTQRCASGCGSKATPPTPGSSGSQHREKKRMLQVQKRKQHVGSSWCDNETAKLLNDVCAVLQRPDTEDNDSASEQRKVVGKQRTSSARDAAPTTTKARTAVAARPAAATGHRSARCIVPASASHPSAHLASVSPESLELARSLQAHLRSKHQQEQQRPPRDLGDALEPYFY